MSGPDTTGRDLVPRPARLLASRRESADTRTLVLAPDPPLPAFDAARPGQFAMVSVLGIGEAAFSFSSLPSAGAAPGTVVVTVRRVGRVTSALHALEPGARVGVRGPYGHGFPLAPAAPTVFVAGGCGLSPLKSAIDLQLAIRPAATPVAVVYGARDVATRIHAEALAEWARRPGVRVLECVERAGRGWWGRVGYVTDLIDEAVASIAAERAAVCGPTAMLAAAGRRLRSGGLAGTAIHLALERHMQCGVGLCGHCYLDHRYLCVDGPVLALAELDGLPEAAPVAC